MKKITVSPTKLFESFIEIVISFTSHYPKTAVAMVNNPIHSKIPWPNIGKFLSVPGKGLTNRVFVVRGRPVTILCGFKVEFCVEKWFQRVLAWSNYMLITFSLTASLEFTRFHHKTCDPPVLLRHQTILRRSMLLSCAFSHWSSRGPCRHPLIILVALRRQVFHENPHSNCDHER